MGPRPALGLMMAPASPSTDSSDLIARVRLACVPGMGPRLARRLVAAFGSLEGLFAAPVAAVARVEKVGPRLAEAVVSGDSLRQAEAVLESCRRSGVAILLEGRDPYPPLLSRIDDPPTVLFCRGSLEPRDSLSVAIVGSRHATPYGMRAAERLAGGLARAGLTIISGLARGIDSAAHRGALAAGGRTLAVLGNGVLAVYPPEHEDLAAEVAAQGAVLSETPPQAEPVPGCFPRRNRIVSGMALGTVVVQAAERSGALITARLAGEQGREVFAVPGPIDCRASKGCHRLIQDGAKLVGDVDDILEELGPLFETALTPGSEETSGPSAGPRASSAPDGPLPPERLADLADTERTVLLSVGHEATAIDTIVETTGLAASEVLSAIAMLELRRFLRRVPGSAVERR